MYIYTYKLPAIIYKSTKTQFYMIDSMFLTLKQSMWTTHGIRKTKNRQKSFLAIFFYLMSLSVNLAKCRRCKSMIFFKLKENSYTLGKSPGNCLTAWKVTRWNMQSGHDCLWNSNAGIACRRKKKNDSVLRNVSITFPYSATQKVCLTDRWLKSLLYVSLLAIVTQQNSWQCTCF